MLRAYFRSRIEDGEIYICLEGLDIVAVSVFWGCCRAGPALSAQILCQVSRQALDIEPILRHDVLHEEGEAQTPLTRWKLKESETENEIDIIKRNKQRR